MRKKLLLFCMVFLSLFGAHATTTTPINSTVNGSDVWYFIQCDRSGINANAKWLTGAPTGFPLSVMAFNAGDAQRWKVVTTGDGIALQNKAYGNYLNSDIVLGGSNPRITAKADLPTLALRIYTNGSKAGSVSLIDNAATITGTTVAPTTSFGIAISSILQPSSGAGFAVNHSLMFYEESEKGVLTELTAAATLLSANTSLGNRLAQSKTDLDAANVTAAGVRDDVASTGVNYLAATNSLSAAVVNYNAAGYTTLTVSSADASNEKWYLLKGQRTAATYATSLGAGLGVESRGFSNSDSQWWKIVPNGTAGYALKNKATGEYLNTDIGVVVGAVTDLAITTKATAPTTSVVFNVSTALAGSVWIENINAYPGVTNNYFRLYDGTAPIVRDKINDAGINSSWLLQDLAAVDMKIVLNSTITTVTAKLTATTPTAPSLNPGNYPAQARTDLQTAITTATDVYNNVNSTNTDYLNATVALNAALTTYNASLILPTVSSVDATNERWYLLQGMRPAGTYVTSTGAGQGVFSRSLVGDDSQLWKVVPNGANGNAFVNKKTGEYLATDVATDTPLLTQSTAPTLSVVFNTSSITITNGVASFWIESYGTTSASETGVAFRLHAGDKTNPVKNWFGNRTDNSSWMIYEYSAANYAAFLTNAIAAANALVADATFAEGTASGQYPTGAKTTLSAAITTAQAASASTDVAVLQAATVALNTAITNYKLSMTTNFTSTAAAPKWFYIRNLLRSDAAAVKNQVVSAAGIVENGLVPCETKANTNDQLWRFEAGANGGVKIINASQPTLAIKEGAYAAQTSLVATATATEFTIQTLGTGFKIVSLAYNPLNCDASTPTKKLITTIDETAGNASNWAIEERAAFLPQTITFAAIPAKLTTDAAFNVGASTNAVGLTLTYVSSNTAVATVASDGTVTLKGIAGTSDITVSNAGDATYSKASVKQPLTVTIPTGVQSATDGISVVVKDRVIVVLGTNSPVKAFAVTGAEVDATRALKPGIYIAKVAGKTVKVNVR